jgi:hypothetical protein
MTLCDNCGATVIRTWPLVDEAGLRWSVRSTCRREHRHWAGDAGWASRTRRGNVFARRALADDGFDEDYCPDHVMAVPLETDAVPRRAMADEEAPPW